MKRRKRLKLSKRAKRSRAAEVARKLRHGSDPQFSSPHLLYVSEVNHGYRPGDALFVHGHGNFVVRSVSETGITLEPVDGV